MHFLHLRNKIWMILSLEGVSFLPIVLCSLIGLENLYFYCTAVQVQQKDIIDLLTLSILGLVLTNLPLADSAAISYQSTPNYSKYKVQI